MVSLLHLSLIVTFRPYRKNRLYSIISLVMSTLKLRLVTIVILISDPFPLIMDSALYWKMVRLIRLITLTLLSCLTSLHIRKVRILKQCLSILINMVRTIICPLMDSILHKVEYINLSLASLLLRLLRSLIIKMARNPVIHVVAPRWWH